MFPDEYLNHSNGPFNKDYLMKFESVLTKALNEHRRTLAIRVDLRLPSGWAENDCITCLPNLGDDLFSRFIRSLKAKVKHYRSHSQNAHPCNIRYLWVKEIDTSSVPHYHVMLFLNKDLFKGLGYARSDKRHLWNMIQEAWLSALKLTGYDEYRSLAHFPDNPTYVLNYNAADYQEQYRSFVFRLSYLAKERTKVYSQRSRSIGCSQY